MDLAQHPRLPRRYALKLLPEDWSADTGYRAPFGREADVASTLWHPRVHRLHEADVEACFGDVDTAQAGHRVSPALSAQLSAVDLRIVGSARPRPKQRSFS